MILSSDRFKPLKGYFFNRHSYYHLALLATLRSSLGNSVLHISRTLFLFKQFYYYLIPLITFIFDFEHLPITCKEFMDYKKILAIVFSVLTFGAIKETHRIFTSSAPDIATNRKELTIMAIIITGVFIFLASLFWRKSSKKNRL